MFWALLGGLSFCRHCIIRPQGLVWSEDYLTFISPSHLNQFLTFYETLLTNDFVKISITHWTLLKYDCLLIFILNWWNVSVCFIYSLRGANRVWWEQCTHHCRPFAFWSFLPTLFGLYVVHICAPKPGTRLQTSHPHIRQITHPSTAIGRSTKMKLLIYNDDTCVTTLGRDQGDQWTWDLASFDLCQDCSLGWPWCSWSH